MGIYSNDIKDLKILKRRQNCRSKRSSNEYRGLKLFEDAGVIKLKDGVEEKATKKTLLKTRLTLKSWNWKLLKSLHN